MSSPGKFRYAGGIFISIFFIAFRKRKRKDEEVIVDTLDVKEAKKSKKNKENKENKNKKRCDILFYRPARYQRIQ